MLRNSNMNVSRLVFWQNIVSPHQVPYMRELLSGHGVEEITLVVSEPLRTDLASQGWVTPSTGRLNILVKPDTETVEKILIRYTRSSVHILGGVKGSPVGGAVLARRKQAGYGCGLICEGGNFRGGKGALRRVLYAAEQVRYRGCVDFILAMGQDGVDWYRNVGWPKKQIFPFAYVTETPTDVSNSTGETRNEKGETVRLLFVGQMIPRKGVDVLLKALARCGIQREWRLILAGTGPNLSEHKALSASLGLGDKTEFLGAVPNPKIHGLMASSDLLILSSRFDGWGAVVNEALMCGTPVLCSDACGSKDLLDNPMRGEAVQTENIGKWAEALLRRIERGRVPAGERKQIREWSLNIGGPRVADYFMAVLRHVYSGSPCPLPPWNSTSA
ncbi:MAG: glycosyltransferase [Pseudomonadota bacterium]